MRSVSYCSRRVNPHPAALDGEPAGGEERKRLGERLVLLDLDARVQGLGRVVLEDRHRLLHDDGAGVRSGVDEMNRHARDLASVVERLGPAVDARERGEKRGVDVEDAVRERGEQLGLDDAHEAREHDSVDASALQELDAAVFRRAFQLRLPRRAVEVLAGNAVLLRTVEDLRVRDVREDEAYVCIKRARFDRVDDGLHVRARAGPENSEM